MMTTTPSILALDFDGVLCDGLIEYFQTAWRAYGHIWGTDAPPPEGLADRFYRLRPVVETGWEMPVLLRSLLLGTSEAEIFEHWPTLVQALVTDEQLDKQRLADTVDGVRDEWIAADLDHWLAQHRFYPGLIDRLRQAIATTTVAIVTTKEGRFVSQLLQQQGIQLPADCILGKEVKQPKYQTLRDLRQRFAPDGTIWFVEDRIKALQGVATQADLQDVQLFLAEWGYNTEADRTLAKADPRLHSLTLETAALPFAAWLKN